MLQRNWIAWYWRDFRIDVDRLHLTEAEECRYRRLLEEASETGIIPDDDLEIARMAIAPHRWKAWSGRHEYLIKTAQSLRRFLIPHPDVPGALTQKRLYNELKKAEEQHKRRQQQRGERSPPVPARRAKDMRTFDEPSANVRPPPSTKSNGYHGPGEHKNKNNIIVTNGETVSLFPKEALVGGKRAGARLPQGWVLTDELRLKATDARVRHHLPPLNLDLEAEKFANYYLGGKGARTTCVDWTRAWINWILKADPPTGYRAPAVMDRDSEVARIQAEIDKLAERKS